MNTITRSALATTAILMLAAPTAAAIPDTSEDAARDDTASTEQLSDRVTPLIDQLRQTALDVNGNPYDELPWEALRSEAARGLTVSMTTRVRECSKAYWAMTYSIFGIYYLATSHALYGTTDEALADLSTAMGATELLDAAYARAIRNCRSVVPAPGGAIADVASGVSADAETASEEAAE